MAAPKMNGRLHLTGLHQNYKFFAIFKYFAT